ncbi:phage major capsid protein [Azonexus hydrophilus]|uniref:phage major capsid protein n=1 Tax=Azonexus hydrophilus TaxID=418702 RepID=UPI00196394F9|nr:phage major capsid protein [Azonexus hydrophilus]
MNKIINNRAVQAILAITLVFAAYAMGWLSPEMAVAGGLLPMAIGETDFGSLKDLLVKQGEEFANFKAAREKEASELRSDLDSLHKKLNRPGAAGSGNPGEGHGGLTAGKTSKGAPFYLLKKGERISQRSSEIGEFDLGEFVRDSVVGSRKAMVSGPALVPVGVSDMVIDAVRDLVVVTAAGARTLVIDGPTNLARIDGDPTVIQHTENTDDITESDIDLGYVTSNPKLLAAVIPLSEELVQDSPNLNDVIKMAVAGAFATKIDGLILAKLVADAAIPDSAAGQDPAAWGKVLEAVGSAMALKQQVPSALIGAPGDFIARASQLAAGAGSWLGKPPALAGMAEFNTTGITAGTAIFGDFAKAVLMTIRSEIRLEVIRWKNTGKGQHALVAHARADGYVVQPNALYRMLKTLA